MKRRVMVIALSVAAVVVPATSAAAVTDPAAGTARSVERVKMADGNVFRPARVTIARGDVVKWVNRDNVAHTSTGDAWNSGTVAPGETFRRRFRRAGTFRYRCTIHPTMTGVVVVG